MNGREKGSGMMVMRTIKGGGSMWKRESEAVDRVGEGNEWWKAETGVLSMGGLVGKKVGGGWCGRGRLLAEASWR